MSQIKLKLLSVLKMGALIATLILANSVTLWAHDEICNIVLGETAISNEALNALVDSQRGFNIDILSKNYNGQKKWVILAGETHIKNKADYDLGLKLIEHFDFRGLEGANLEISTLSLIGGSIILFKRSLRQSTSDLPYGSTIHAAAEYTNDRVARDITRALKNRRRAKYFTYDKIKKHVQRYLRPWSTYDEIRISEIATLVLNYIASPDDPGVITNIALEKDHVPDIKENIKFAENLIVYSANFAIGYTLLLHQLNQNAPSTKISLYIEAAFRIALYVYMTLPQFISKDRSEEEWYKNAFPFESGILDARNKTMVKNIDQALKDHPSEDKILVIIGRAHNKGMKKMLIEQYGFSTVDLISVLRRKLQLEKEALNL